MQHILITVSGSNGTQLSAAQNLGNAGYLVATMSLDNSTATAQSALTTAFSGRPPDLVIADLTDASDGLPLRVLCRLLQDSWGADSDRPPILAVLEQKHMSFAELRAFAEDFILSPIRTDELQARIEMLLFRHRHVQNNQTVQFIGVVVDHAGGLAKSAETGQVLPLTPREFDLLAFFVTHRGRMFSRDQLLDLVWGIHFDGGERTVDIHIRRLRAKLPFETAERLQTRRGTGYGLIPND